MRPEAVLERLRAAATQETLAGLRMAADSDAGRAWIGRTALREIEKARDRKR